MSIRQSFWQRILRRHGFTRAESTAVAEEEMEQKRKPSGWKCMPYIIGNETFEKLAGAGLVANFTVYLIREFHMEQVKAANVLNIFFGTTNFAPLVGAFFSDAYVGRFKTLAFSSVASFLGMVTLTLSAVVRQFRPPRCPTTTFSNSQTSHCSPPSVRNLSVLYLSMALLAIGAGGIRPCSLPFGVDQFDRTTEEGRRGLDRFFNWYYFTSTLALFVSMSVMVYVQDTLSWKIGFGIPTVLMLVAIVLFFLGTRLYVHVPPEGSVFSGIVRVFVAAFRKRRLSQQDTPEMLHNPPLLNSNVTPLSLTPQFAWLNKAAVPSPDDGGSPWRLCTLQQVEEVKCLIRIIPIWFSGITCFVALGQQWTFAVLQSLKMDRHLGPHFEIPPGAVGTVAMLGLALFIPIYDLVLVPAARSVTGIPNGITLLQRQGVGLVISVFSMVAAAVLEKQRREDSLSRGGRGGAGAMSVLGLAPQLLVMGVAEAFNGVGQIEFYNRQFPEHMQTLAGSLFFCSLAGASYLSSVLVAVVRRETAGEGRRSWLEDDIDRGRLDYFYYLIAGMGTLNFVYFLVCARHYRYKGGGGCGGL
ncbi:hypothetical protein HPP92_024003 [Vanilla planifolia]|uniref:Uncharacterized protein n=1 Tax=Vanilla planifolia TaxID=51239 RepID=A0A835PLL4_VANPL|nr:hypothetical protein HPP92_024003 [Vanilla planifolia]